MMEKRCDCTIVPRILLGFIGGKREFMDRVDLKWRNFSMANDDEAEIRRNTSS